MTVFMQEVRYLMQLFAALQKMTLTDRIVNVNLRYLKIILSFLKSLWFHVVDYTSSLSAVLVYVNHLLVYCLAVVFAFSDWTLLHQEDYPTCK